MSNQFAISAVTLTLRNLLSQITTMDFSAVPADARPTAQISVTTLPLDSVRDGDGGNGRNQINLFLYHTEPNAAWRNMDIPLQVKPGETAFPPLALTLHYIVTVHSQDNNELIGHLLLGTARRILHVHSVLSRDEIEQAFAVSQLHEQIDGVRITPQPVSLDEISKLWTGFQSEYRLSAAYQVSVVLIESARPPKTPLPVLRRGSEDRGVQSVAAPAPVLRQIRIPNQKSSAESGDVLTVVGDNLGGGGLTVRFRHARLADPLIRLPLSGATANEMRVGLPDVAEDQEVPSKWPAGVYTLSLVVQRPNVPTWTTNELPFALAPQITNVTPTQESEANEPFQLTLTCTPQVLSEQRAVLLFGDREIQADDISTPPDPTAETTLAFTIRGAVAGEYVLRLRIDGIDSIPVDFTTSPPQFDDDQKVTITA